MYIGADYYPEHWPRERWETDADLMAKAGFNVVRLAEFAWVFMEPEEGTFTFAWLDEALEVLASRGISAILCTPTATMPAWVKEAYPDVMAQKRDGTRVVWGVRKNNCFASTDYRRLSQAVTRAMADHFRDTPNVIGWQTDNEFGHPDCFCPGCRADFHAWLKKRYGSLDALNAAWGTHFWGHRFARWEEIELPDDDGSHNPGLCLDRHRFFSDQNVSFQAEQVRILRERCPNHFVTHNFMGLFDELDYYDLAEELDFVTWDNYPVGGPPGVFYDAAAAADVMRGLKKKNFWIMEQTAGCPGWGSFGRNPRPGEIRRVAYQQLAHGADGQVWFRWRTCTAGREQYWHGLLGHDGKPLRRYREAARTAAEYRALEPELAGTTVRADVGIVYDYDTIWAMRIQPGYGPVGGNNFRAAMMRYYAALLRAGVNADMIRRTDDFSAYRVIIAPHLYILPDETARALEEFVKAGGVLLTDCRTGVKDINGLCHDRTLPGLLSTALGIRIEEYESIHEAGGAGYPVVAEGALGGTYTAHHYADWIVAEDALVLAAYDKPHMMEYAAATVNTFGKGRAYYLGTVVDEPAFYDRLVGDVLKAGAVVPPIVPPPGVEISCREGEGRRLAFAVNHTEDTVQVAVPDGAVVLLPAGQPGGSSVELEPFGVAVIRLP